MFLKFRLSVKEKQAVNFGSILETIRFPVSAFQELGLVQLLDFKRFLWRMTLTDTRSFFFSCSVTSG